jgi:hypothetical protein
MRGIIVEENPSRDQRLVAGAFGSYMSGVKCGWSAYDWPIVKGVFP